MKIFYCFLFFLFSCSKYTFFYDKDQPVYYKEGYFVSIARVQDNDNLMITLKIPPSTDVSTFRPTLFYKDKIYHGAMNFSKERMLTTQYDIVDTLYVNIAFPGIHNVSSFRLDLNNIYLNGIKQDNIELNFVKTGNNYIVQKSEYIKYIK